MGLFDIFKKDTNTSKLTTDNGVLGPTYLDGLTAQIQNPKDLQPHEWRSQLMSTSGQTKFQIKFFGQLHEEYKDLIVGTDFAPSLIFAVDNSTGQNILLFDGCKHGYNALFCDNYTAEQINNRPVTNGYKDKGGNELFEIIISTYYGFDFDGEYSEEIDETGLIELIDGSKVEFEYAKRNAYDTLQIWAVNEKGETIDIVSEELA